MWVTNISWVYWQGQGMNPERRHLALGVMLSLSVHALLFSLTFSGQGLGLPGFGFPWQDRRIEAPDLRAVLLPAPVPVLAQPIEPLPTAGGEPPGAIESTMLTLVYPAPPPKMTAAPSAPKVKPKTGAKSKTVVAAPDVPSPSVPAPVLAPLSTEQPSERAPPPVPNENLIAVAQSDESRWTVPPAPEVSTPVTAVAPSAASSEIAMPLPRDAGEVKQDAQRQAEPLLAERQEAARQEVVRVEAVRQATARQEAAQQELTRQEVAKQALIRQESVRQEAVRQEAAREEAARVETARLEAERQETAKQAAARAEATRVETARREAAKAEAGRQDAARAEAARVEGERQAQQAAARQETARQDAARLEGARAEAARVEAARLAALQAEAEKREERLRAIGRQLNEEADRREAAAVAQRLSPSSSSARRGRLFGRTDPNAELISYAEAWARKIQLNMTFDRVREAAKQPHTQPLVTVAIRSDGSVESVTFVTSSGVAAIDEAIRSIIHSQANYQAFPPGLLRDYDVVEIRRTWHFDSAIRLY
jgi:membrane protein involved in colicin uptake